MNDDHYYLVKMIPHEKGKERRLGERTISRCFSGGVMMMGMMMGILFSRGVDIHVDKCLHFCRGAPKFCGARSSVYRHAVKGILMTISSILAAQLKIFYGVSERRHALYWISLCDVFRMCFCYLLDRNLFLYSYDIVKLLCTLYFTPFTTLVNSW